MRKIAFATGLLIMAGFGITGCYNDNSEELYPLPSGSLCDTTSVTYEGVIKNIFNQNCALSNCHATRSNPGGYILDNYAGAMAAASTGRLLGAVNHETGYSAMPKNMSKLSSCDILKIQAWINRGMPQQ